MGVTMLDSGVEKDQAIT